MTLKVYGIEAARKVRGVMRANCRGMAEIGRASEVERTYWIHCPDLDALGEQRVLEALPVGTLVRVESATHRAPEPVVVPVPLSLRLEVKRVPSGRMNRGPLVANE